MCNKDYNTFCYLLTFLKRRFSLISRDHLTILHHFFYQTINQCLRFRMSKEKNFAKFGLWRSTVTLIERLQIHLLRTTFTLMVFKREIYLFNRPTQTNWDKGSWPATIHLKYFVARSRRDHIEWRNQIFPNKRLLSAIISRKRIRWPQFFFTFLT